MSSQPLGVETRVASDGPTVVGVDLGVRNLLVAAPAIDDPRVEVAYAVDGDEVRQLYHTLQRERRQLRDLPSDTSEREARLVDRYRDQLATCVAGAVDGLLAYLDVLDAGVVALEDVSYPGQSLTACRTDDVDAGTWVLPTMESAIASAARSEGYRVELVSPEFTTKQCHVCGQLGRVDHDELTCTTPGCPVDEVDRDRSAAVSVAKRAHPLD
jgi:putative transposase